MAWIAVSKAIELEKSRSSGETKTSTIVYHARKVFACMRCVCVSCLRVCWPMRVSVTVVKNNHSSTLSTCHLFSKTCWKIAMYCSWTMYVKKMNFFQENLPLFFAITSYVPVIRLEKTFLGRFKALSVIAITWEVGIKREGKKCPVNRLWSYDVHEQLQ